MQTYPVARHLVLIGGGHSHVIFLRMLGMNPLPGLSVTLVSPDSSTPYSGMLPGLIAGHYERDDVYIDLVPLCRFAGADFIQVPATGLNLIEHKVQLANRPDIGYDLLSIDIGSTPSIEIEGDGVTPVKPISQLLEKWEAFLDRIEPGNGTKIGFVGAGAGGVELLLAVNQHLKSSNVEAQLHIFTDAKTVLPDFPAGVRVVFERILAEQNIEVHRDFRASAYSGGKLSSTDDREQPLDEVFWVTQAGTQHWPGEAGLAVDTEGFIQTTNTLQSISHENVFAVGDCATIVAHPRPKAGVFAVRQGKPLFENIKSYVLGKSLKAHVPQKEFLSLLTTGPKHAVASRNGLHVEGERVWEWKNWIDQRFMHRFSELPEMKREAPNTLQAEFDEQMHCGGCGSKISSDLLKDALRDIMGEADIPDDDAAVIEVPEGKILLQSVDHFRSMLNDPYLQARIAVSHSASDIYACGGELSSALAMFTLPFAKPGVTRVLLRQMLAGTLEQLELEDARLLGGHTSEGMELSIGFSVNGLVDPSSRFSKQGLRMGDNLILTNPLGTGTILAADMQYKAKGRWVEEAVGSMLQSNRQAASVFRESQVSACTDITGFGLAGHIQEMIGGDSFGVTLDLDSIPLLAGAEACINQLGITSTLHSANRNAVELVGAHSRLSEIIFDPQTSGGLVGAVSQEETERCLANLQAAGYERAAVVGTVVEGRGIQVTGGDS